jgi:hypothetical protein
MPPQDDGNEDSDLSASFNEEAKWPPQQIHRNESKKQGGYTYPEEPKKLRAIRGRSKDIESSGPSAQISTLQPERQEEN